MRGRQSRVVRGRLLGGKTVTGLADTGMIAYRAAPRCWNEYVRGRDRPIGSPPRIPNPLAWPDTGLHIAWLGHSTVLIKVNGYTILTDPVFSDYAGFSLGRVTFGARRLVSPAIELHSLPRPDLILLSHAHLDHFDRPSLRALEDSHTRVVTAWETADLLRFWRYRGVLQMRWGEQTRIGPATVRAFEVNHWGARVRTDTYRGYNGYRIDVGRYRILFAGDTADTHLFRSLKCSRPYDVAVMPIGAYNPWRRHHCTPEQAWKMANDAVTEFVVPVHHQTFILSDEPVSEPLERFYHAAARHPDRIALDSIGQEFHLV